MPIISSIPVPFLLSITDVEQIRSIVRTNLHLSALAGYLRTLDAGSATPKVVA